MDRPIGGTGGRFAAIMPRVYSASANSLVYVRRFRRPARLLGMVFVAVGLSLCLGLWLAPPANMPSSTRAVALATGLLSTMLGGTLLLGRAGRAIDHASGTASRWWGLGIPLMRCSRPLAEVVSVAAAVDDRTREFAVYLVDASGEAWEFLGSRDAAVVRQVAAEVAVFLGRPWLDQTCVTSAAGPTIQTAGAEETANTRLPPERHQ